MRASPAGAILSTLVRVLTKPKRLEAEAHFAHLIDFLAGEPGTAFVGEPVFLEAAGGFVRNGGFDQLVRQRWIDIVFADMSAVGEAQQVANFGVAQFTVSGD